MARRHSIINVLLLAASLLLCAAGARAAGVRTFGTPFVRHFSSHDYGERRLGGGMCQGPSGVLYFASTGGLLEFDGGHWIEHVPGQSKSVRSVMVDSAERVYVGMHNEFGYFRRDSLGRMRYTDLSHGLGDINFGAVTRIVSYRDAVYFVADQRHVFRYAAGAVTRISLPETLSRFRCFVLGDNFFLFDNHAGLARMRGRKFQMYQTGMFEEGVSLSSLLPYDSTHLLAAFSDQGLMLLDTAGRAVTPALDPISVSRISYRDVPTRRNPQEYTLLHTEADDDIVSSGITSIIRLQSGGYAVATRQGGIHVIDANGRMVDRFGLDEGLPDNRRMWLFEDAERNLWAVYDNGASVIEHSAALRGMPSSVLGDNVISVAAAGDKVFAGTTQGLYVITDMSRPGDRGDYRVELATRRITGVLAVTPYSARGRQHVLFSSLRKVHDIDLATGAVTNIADLTFATSIAFYPPDSSYLFVGHQAGLTLLRRGADGRYSVVPMRSQVNVSVQNLFFDKSGAMFLDTDKELSTLRFPNPADPSAPLRSDYGVATGLPRDEDNMWLMLRDTARVVSDGVVYRPATGDLFAGPAPLFTPDICLNKYVEPNSDIGSIYMHKLRGSVVYTNKSVLMCDGPELVSISFRRHNSRHVGSLAIDERGRLWISRDEHLYCHDLQAVAMSHRASAPRLRLAEAHIGGSRAAVKYNGKEWDLGPIPFENNSLSLRVSLPSYCNMEAARFAFRLSRLDKEWGEWQSTGNYSISYLPAGDYVLSARAVDGIGKACPEIQIRFTVGRPWWGSLEAVILYVFAVILLTWLVVFLYNWKLYKERERLRLAVEDAVGMVQVQKEALEHQASELLRANAEMEKLSVVARYTDNAVVIMDGKGNYEWVNEGFERMYGFGLEQLTAADEGERLGRHSTQKVPEMASVWFDEKKTVVYESLSRHADGREFWTQTTLTPVLNMKGEIQNLIGIDIDINAIKEAEIEIQRQKEEASRQRDLAIAQRNEMYAQKKEMTESIRYAQNIQRILFSGKEDLERLFPYGFIINKPRDIVSGDFFLCFSVDNYRVVIVADCTGHGVPGAFMSLIGVRFFDDIVQGHGCVMPDQILNLLRDRIIVALKQTENTGDLKDGMDVAVVTVDIASGVMYYAGANNPVYVLNQGELEEILPDKMSICISEFVDKPFTLNTVPFRPGNKVYMFTDGVVDQFGGFDQKKLKSKGFKDSIKIAQSFDIENQGDMLARFIDEWRGSLDQVDDILIVGFDVDSGLDIKS